MCVDLRVQLFNLRQNERIGILNFLAGASVFALIGLLEGGLKLRGCIFEGFLEVALDFGDAAAPINKEGLMELRLDSIPAGVVTGVD